MSGICGIIYFDDAPLDRDELSAMVQAAAYRGTNGVSFWHNTQIGLAYLAQFVSHESVDENQPLVSRDVVLVADVRIDNRDDLIHTLRASGHLQSERPTDADILMAAYYEWGTACAAHILGDFVFAIWDDHKQHFFAARDPMGLRTLYFWRDSKRTAFATEVKQLLSVSFIPARLFEPAVAVFLTGPFLPLEWSFYEGITQLAPGQAILVDASSSRVWRFWDADPSKMVRYKNENDYADHFRELFKNAVASRLRTIKPVGLSLSGGMDSGSIAATAGWLFQHNQVDQVQFRAYCYAFEELSDSDERHVSQGITSYYGLTQVDIPADQLWPLKDALVHGPDRDDPYISTFQALHDAVFARAQADGTGLLLAGYRGDEIVGSWAVDYLGMLFDRQWNTLLHELNAVCRDQNIGLWSAVRSRLISPIRWALWPHPGPRAWFASQKSPRDPSWIHPEFAERVHLADLLRDRFTSPRTLRRYGWYQRYNQIFSYPPVRVAIHAERMQAKYGIAYADPWSDRRLAEFVLAIPQWVVHRYTEPKRLAHRAIQGIFPPILSHRPAKIEPVAVYRRGMNERAKNTIFDLIDNGVADERGYIDKAALREAYEQYLCGRMPRYDFWWPLTLELWLRKFWN